MVGAAPKREAGRQIHLHKQVNDSNFYVQKLYSLTQAPSPAQARSRGSDAGDSPPLRTCGRLPGGTSHAP